MTKTSRRKIAIIILFFTTLLMAFVAYTMWQKNEAMVRDDYGRYVKSQYALRDLLFNSLKVSENRYKFIDNLALVKGELISTTHILEQVKMPQNLQGFHERGLSICNEAFSAAVYGKPLGIHIGELREYMEELDRLLIKLNYSQVIDNKSPENIYQTLNDISEKMDW